MEIFEKRIIWSFLDSYGNILGNAGCNDFDLRYQKMKEADRDQLINDYCNYMRRTGGWTDEEVERQKKHPNDVTDFCLVGMLREKLMKEIK